MEQSTLGLARAGTWGIRDDGGYAQIVRIYWGRVVDKDRTEKDERGNPRKREIGRTELLVEYRYEKHVSAARLLDRTKVAPLAEYQKKYTHIEGTLEAHLEVSKVLSNGGELPKELAEAISQQQHENSRPGGSLVTSSNPDFLRAVEQQAERNVNVATVLQAALRRNMTEMQNRLATQMAGLHQAMEAFQLTIKKVQRLITTLELYLGVHENLIQIASGEKASETDPITLRQLVLFADEELGDPRKGGITFKQLHQFDEWLVDSGAYKLLAPEKRCIVAIKPRRYARKSEAGEVLPPMQDAQGKYLDSYTYILIRNGDNLYRIQTPNVEVGTTLFPLRKDVQAIYDRISQVQQLEQDYLDGKCSESYVKQERSKVEEETFGYQKSVLLLQGLLFRTDVLHPLPPGLNLANPDTYGGMVEFIYDAEALLPSGRLSFRDWQRDLNSRIRKGSRVLLAIHKTQKNRHISPSDYKSRFTLSMLLHDDNTPPLPELGVYSVTTYSERKVKALFNMVPWGEAKQRDRDEWLSDNRRFDSDLGKFVAGADEPKELKVYQYDEKNRVKHEEYFVDHLAIRYNPGDTVIAGGWGKTYSEHTRKNAVGFCLEPKHDQWLFNYDELTLDDINFYLTDRVERHNYASMMPFLYELRNQLEKEQAWENEFIKLLSERLHDELSEQLPAGIDLLALGHEAVRWYKLDKVKIKRSLTDQDAKALRMVEQRVRHYLRERHGLKEIEAGVDYRKKTLIWFHKQTGRSFVGTGLLKADFVEECLAEATYRLPWEYCKPKATGAGRVSRNRIDREMQDTTLAAAVELAAATAGQVIELETQRAQSAA
jgi:hypothetical protein